MKKIFNFFVYAFALIGFTLVSGFFAIRLGWTNVSGIIDGNNISFERRSQEISLKEISGNPEVKGVFSITDINEEINNLEKIKTLRSQNYCKLKIIADTYPTNVKKIIEAGEATKSDPIVAKMALAVELGFTRNQHMRSLLDNCIGYPGDNVDYSALSSNIQNKTSQNIFPWINRDEWRSVKEASRKDKSVIDKVSRETGVESRLIVSNMIVEQLRLMSSEREIFKKFFEPLKVLCSANKISLGVMGIKEATAVSVEEHLKDSSSPYYLGKEYENLLDFKPGKDIASSRYARLTDDKNHYYSYLYGALYLRQLMEQWQNAGYDVTYRPEIIGTLFNVGFTQSDPKSDPKVGGSEIKIGDRQYSFGSLAYEFYYSGELLEDFPYEIK